MHYIPSYDRFLIRSLIELPIAIDGLKLRWSRLSTISIALLALLSRWSSRVPIGAGWSIIGELKLLSLLIEKRIVLLALTKSLLLLLLLLRAESALQLSLLLQVELRQRGSLTTQRAHNVRIRGQLAAQAQLLSVDTSLGAGQWSVLGDRSHATSTASDEAALGWAGAIGVEGA